MKKKIYLYLLLCGLMMISTASCGSFGQAMLMGMSQSTPSMYSRSGYSRTSTTPAPMAAAMFENMTFTYDPNAPAVTTPPATAYPNTNSTYSSPTSTSSTSTANSTSSSSSKVSRKSCVPTLVGDYRYCGGDGRCSLCGGDGLMDAFGLNNVECSLCHGSGKCVSCHGTGYLD